MEILKVLSNLDFPQQNIVLLFKKTVFIAQHFRNYLAQYPDRVKPQPDTVVKARKAGSLEAGEQSSQGLLSQVVAHILTIRTGDRHVVGYGRPPHAWRLAILDLGPTGKEANRGGGCRHRLVLVQGWHGFTSVSGPSSLSTEPKGLTELF